MCDDLTARYGPCTARYNRCKDLGRWALVSSAFRRCFPNRMVSLGHHVMRGVEAPREIFTLIDHGD